jgi:hypothetical protein
VIDICITATKRPELLTRTLESFEKNLFKDLKKFRAVINIDDAGPKERKAREVLYLCKKKFGEVVHRYGTQPHFGRAFHWVWSNSSSDLMFHLEEDWELLVSVDLEKYMAMFKKHKKLAHLRLSWVKTTKTCKNWRSQFPFNGDFFECPKNVRGSVGWCGHPSFNDKRFVKKVLKFLNPNQNPEKQIKKGGDIGKILNSWRFGVYSSQNSSAQIRDIGRLWMAKNGFKKREPKYFFTQWDVAK